MASEAGKGSKQRPGDIEAYAKNWDLIFGKKKDEDKDRRPVETGDSGNTKDAAGNKD